MDHLRISEISDALGVQRQLFELLLLGELLLMTLNLLHHLILEIGLVCSALIDAFRIRKLNEILSRRIVLHRPSKMVVCELLAVTHAAQLRVEEIAAPELDVGGRG